MRIKHACRMTGFAGLFIILMLAVLLPGCSDDSNPTDVQPDQDTTSAGFTAADFESAEDCKGCHPDQYDQWSGSMHAYATVDPVCLAYNLKGQRSYINAVDQGCYVCHATIGSMSGETPWGELDLDGLSPVSKEGITCDLCHTITALGSIQNGNFVLSPGNTKYGSIVRPVENAAHKSAYNPLYSSSEYCGVCHDIITDDGFELEATFREWQHGGFAATDSTCNGCHMPAYTGSAAVGAPERTLHDHSMPGVDIAQIDFPNKPEQRAGVIALLQSALTMEVDIPGVAVPGGTIDLQVRLINDKTGHAVPSGATFLRQMWLEVIVTNPAGDTVYSTGLLDSNGDLMDDYSAFPERDADLFNAQATMLRADGVPTLDAWESTSLINPTLQVGETRAIDYQFTAPVMAAGGYLTVDIKLHFRAFAPYFMKYLGLEHMAPLPIFDMEEATGTINMI